MMLRLHLAEVWEPKDYLDAMSATEALYYIMAYRHELTDCPWLFAPLEWDYRFLGPARPRQYQGWVDMVTKGLVEHSRLLADHEHRLFVIKVSHASPGFIDFEGLGDVIRALKETVAETVGFFTGREERREKAKQAALETEQRRIDVESAKIDLIRKQLELLDEIQDRKDRYPPEMRPQIERALVAELSKIENLAARGLLTDQREHKDD